MYNKSNMSLSVINESVYFQHMNYCKPYIQLMIIHIDFLVWNQHETHILHVFLGQIEWE